MLNRVFEEYLVPFSFTAEQLCLHIAYHDIDTALSPIWFDDAGNVIAAALLGIRGRRAWIGGFGVAPDHRRQGHARALADSMLAAARTRHMESVTLEVLCANAPAIAVYEKTGFSIARTLHSVETNVTQAGPASGIDVVDPVRFIEGADDEVPCWQREAASLRNGAAPSAVAGVDGQTYALFRQNATRAQILKLRVGAPGQLTALASTFAEDRQSRLISIFNEPEGSAVLRHARQEHWREPFLQFEMRLQL